MQVQNAIMFISTGKPLASIGTQEDTLKLLTLDLFKMALVYTDELRTNSSGFTSKTIREVRTPLDVRACQEGSISDQAGEGYEVAGTDSPASLRPLLFGAGTVEQPQPKNTPQRFRGDVRPFGVFRERAIFDSYSH